MKRRAANSGVLFNVFTTVFRAVQVGMDLLVARHVYEVRQ